MKNILAQNCERALIEIYLFIEMKADRNFEINKEKVQSNTTKVDENNKAQFSKIAVAVVKSLFFFVVVINNTVNFSKSF